MRSIQALLALTLVAVAGCSSYRPERFEAIPSERLLGYQQASDGTGTLELHREVGFMGGGCYVMFSIDRQPAARIGVGEQASFQLMPGRHIVGIGADTEDDTLCAHARLNREAWVEVVEDGKPAHVRIYADNRKGFDMDIKDGH